MATWVRQPGRLLPPNVSHVYVISSVAGTFRLTPSSYPLLPPLRPELVIESEGWLPAKALTANIECTRARLLEGERVCIVLIECVNTASA